MTKHSDSIHKKLLQTKYLLGIVLLAIIVLVVLFIRSKAVIAPEYSESTENAQVPAPTWNCPATVWLDCSGEEASSKDICTPEYIAWVRETCPDFQGVVK